jgi:localization factor PodJL
MKSAMSWSLRGVDAETREAVLEAARQSGVSVGEWLRLVLDEDDGRPSRSVGDRLTGDDAGAVAAAVEQLTHRTRTIDAPTATTMAGLRARLAEIEGGTAHQPGDKASANILSRVINDITRSLDTDEQARTKVEGLGQRRAEPAGHADVTDTIRDLEQRIEPIGASPPAPDHSASLEEIRDQLNVLLARPASPRQAPRDRAAAIGEALRSLEARLDGARAPATALQRKPTETDGAESKDPTRRLAESLAEITSRLGPRPAEAPRPARSRSGHLASAIAEISQRQRRLDENAEEPAPGHDPRTLANGLAALRGDIATLSERVTAIGRGGAEAGRWQSDLARRIHALTAERPVDRKLLDTIRSDLAVVRAELANSARRAGTDGGNARFDRLAGEIAALRRSLENAESPGAISRLETRVAELADAVRSTLAARTGQPDPFDRLGSNLDDIRKSIEALQTAGADSGADHVLTRLEARLNNIATRLDRVLDRAAPVKALDEIKSEIAVLRVELAEQARAGTDKLETEIRALAERLDNLPERDGRSLAELEAQVAAMANDIARSLPRPGALQRVEADLSQLQAKLADDRRESVAAARAAAREAAREVSDSRATESKLINSLRDDLDDLRKAADAADQDNPAATDADNETLTQVVQRLSQLERETTESAATIGGDSDPTIPRANRAAAAAWSAAYRGAAAGNETQTASRPAKSDIAALRELAESSAAEQRTSERRGDFIAAARRAAQAAAVEATTRGERTGAQPGKSSAFSRIGEAIRARKGPMLVAAVAATLALGALQLYGGGAHNGNEQSLVGPTERDRVLPASGDRGEAVITVPEPTATSVQKAALVALPAVPDAATAFAEPISFANHFGGIPGTPPADSFAVDTQGAAGPNARDGEARIMLAAASAPWPDAERLASSAVDNPVAAFEIAARYAQGGGAADLAKAATWYRRAAAGGMAVAQYRLASLYERGQGVARDLRQAVAWYRRAAAQGNVEAMHNLAVLLSDGGGGSPDKAAARRWFLAAANHGITDSQYNLGVIYALGIGVERDYGQSYTWFAIAAGGGDEDAASRRDQVAANLSPDELAKARATVNAWRAEPVLAEANQLAIPPAGGSGLVTADRQALVRKIQALLVEQGYDPGPADGVEGPKTRQAIRAYQRTLGMSETGRIDGSLAMALADPQG